MRQPWAAKVGRGVVLALAMAGLVPGGSVLAGSPDPSLPPSEGDVALTLVRAQDPRFADLPTTDELQRTIGSNFDMTPLLAGSWIGVSQTFGTTADTSPGWPTWVDLGLGRTIEVMLVAGCPATLDGPIPSGTPDPCGWRHTWLYHVARDGTVTTIAEVGSLDTPECYQAFAAEGTVRPPRSPTPVCDDTM